MTEVEVYVLVMIEPRLSTDAEPSEVFYLARGIGRGNLTKTADPSYARYWSSIMEFRAWFAALPNDALRRISGRVLKVRSLQMVVSDVDTHLVTVTTEEDKELMDYATYEYDGRNYYPKLIGYAEIVECLAAGDSVRYVHPRPSTTPAIGSEDREPTVTRRKGGRRRLAAQGQQGFEGIDDGRRQQPVTGGIPVVDGGAGHTAPATRNLPSEGSSSAAPEVPPGGANVGPRPVRRIRG